MSARAARIAWSLIPLTLVALACDGGEHPPPEEALPWFEEVARERGLAFEHRSGHAEDYLMPEIMGGGAALFDADGDADLDLFLVQSGRLEDDGSPPDVDRLYLNQGRGTFQDATAGSGADDPRYGMGATCGDVDDDGDTDLFVTNVGRDTLLANEGGGRFRDVTEVAGAGDGGWGTSAAFFDADADGCLDLFVVNYLDWSPARELPCMDALSRPDYCSPKNYNAPARSSFYRNLGDGRFEDRSRSSGIAAKPGTGLGVVVADFDADGGADVFVANDGMANHLWRNRRDGSFEEVARAWGCATDSNGLEKAGMGVAVADIDFDLDPDLLVCNLQGESDSYFQNQGAAFVDRTPTVGLGLVSKPFTRFGMGWVDFDQDGSLDLYQANGRVQRATRSFAADPYAEPSLLFQSDGRGGFVEVLPRGGTAQLLVETSRAAAFGDVDGDGAIDIVVANRDGPVRLLLNRVASREPKNHWVLLSVLERSGRDALGATVDVLAGERTLRREVRAAYSYLASNDPRVHVGLGPLTRIEEVRVRWVGGAEERFGPFDADQIHVLRRGAGRP